MENANKNGSPSSCQPYFHRYDDLRLRVNLVIATWYLRGITDGIRAKVEMAMVNQPIVSPESRKVELGMTNLCTGYIEFVWNFGQDKQRSGDGYGQLTHRKS